MNSYEPRVTLPFSRKPSSSGAGIRAMAPEWLYEAKLSQHGLSTGLFNLKLEGIIGQSPPLEQG